MIARTAIAFRRAADVYRFEPAKLTAEALAAARASLRATRMMVLGESHGVAETPRVAYALMRELDLSALALEWSYEELDVVTQRFVSGGPLDLDELWALTPGAEFFCGDGRITAGHIALLERLRDEGRLRQVVLIDRLDPEPPDDWRPRELDLATRLLAERDPEVPILVLVGAFHCCLESDDGATMAMHVAERQPGLRPLVIDYAEGEGWSRGATFDATRPRLFDAGVPLTVPRATPAVVPGAAI